MKRPDPQPHRAQVAPDLRAFPIKDAGRMLVVRRQTSPSDGWVIVACEAAGDERQLIGLFKSKAAAQRWVEEHPGFWPHERAHA